MKPILLFLLIITLGTANESDAPSPPLEMWLVKNKSGQVDHLLMGTEKGGDKILPTYKNLGVKLNEINFLFKIGPGVELQAIQTAVTDAKTYQWKSIAYSFLTEGATRGAGGIPATWSPQQKDAIRTWLAQAGVAFNKGEKGEIKEIITEETGPVPVSKDAPMTATPNPEPLAVVKTNGPLTLSSTMSGRSNSGRKQAVGKYGGSGRGQASVNRALRWLASVQNANGSWGVAEGQSTEPGHCGHTGLALLVFLAHGETPLSEMYGRTVQNAMRWLATYGNQNGLNVKKPSMGYAHAMATIAIAESYEMTKIPIMQTAMEHCIDKLIDGQMPNGGFVYRYSNSPRWDLSVSSWNMQALAAAKSAGSTNAKLPAAIKKAIAFCKIAYVGNGGFGYASTTSSKSNMGGAGTLSLQLLGAATSTPVTEGSARIGQERLKLYQEVVNDPTKWKTVGSKNLYGWYYDTQVMFNTQTTDKARWKLWRKAFETVLIGAQHAEGYWETNSPGCGATTPGRVLATSWAALQLEVYYRYQPLEKSQR